MQKKESTHMLALCLEVELSGQMHSAEGLIPHVIAELRRQDLLIAELSRQRDILSSASVVAYNALCKVAANTRISQVHTAIKGLDAAIEQAYTEIPR